MRVIGRASPTHPAVVSLGTRPTINGTDPLLEVHLFDFDGDLYGQYLSVDFVRRLRDEKKFASLDALVEQMHVDASAGARRACRAERMFLTFLKLLNSFKISGSLPVWFAS